MGAKIKKVIRWVTEDGVEHSSQEMAEQHLLNSGMLDLLTGAGNIKTRDLAQDVINVLTSHRHQTREYLNACDAMEQAARRTTP